MLIKNEQIIPQHCAVLQRHVWPFGRGFGSEGKIERLISARHLTIKVLWAKHGCTICEMAQC